MRLAGYTPLRAPAPPSSRCQTTRLASRCTRPAGCRPPNPWASNSLGLLAALRRRRGAPGRWCLARGTGFWALDGPCCTQSPVAAVPSLSPPLPFVPSPPAPLWLLLHTASLRNVPTSCADCSAHPPGLVMPTSLYLGVYLLMHLTQALFVGELCLVDGSRLPAVTVPAPPGQLG